MIDRQRLEDDLEAFALHQLDADTRRAFEQSLVDHPDLAARAASLQVTLAAVGRANPAPPPASLRTRLLDTALAERPPGHPVEAGSGGTGGAGQPGGAAAPAPAPVVYREAVADALDLVGTLTPDEMAAATIYHIPVVEMISHIGGTEAYLADRLGLAPYPGEIADHVDLRDRGADLADPADVVTRWRQAAQAVGSRVAALEPSDLDSLLSFHGYPMTVAGLLVARGFELWTHAEDICRATGRPLRPPSGPALRTMADGAVTLLGTMLAVDGRHRGRSLRVTLTGDGGGSWLWTIGSDDQPGDPAATADATVVDDVTHFCRLMAARVEPELDDGRLLGDRDLLQTVMQLAPSQADFGTGPVANGHRRPHQP